MQSATLEKYATSLAKLKASGKRPQGNIFLSAPELEKLFAQKNCFLADGENSLFLLIPRHSLYHELLFYTASPAELDRDLTVFLLDKAIPGALRASVIGLEPMAGEYAAIFQKHGFALLKKLLRTICKEASDKIAAITRQYADENREYMGFARPGDEDEILDILKENFDVAADNLPEPYEIRKAIDAEQVAVLRKDGQILSLIYFNMQSRVVHSLYDVTREEHRGANGYCLALGSFLNDELKAKGVEIARYYGWREEAKKKLVKHAKKSNQNFDGVVIYNTLRPAGTSEAS